jgi:hypothetical protein
MPLADYDAYLSAFTRAADFSTQVIATRNVGRMTVLQIAPTPAIPTTSVALDKSSDRAINSFVSDAGSGRLSILGGRFSPSGVSGVGLLLVDLLNISGGMSGAVAGAQSTNLPTAALPRYTSGEGVFAAIIGHSGIGATATTVTATYTNSDGTGSRVSTAMDIGAGARDAGLLVTLPVQGEDKGTRSVESINIAATTGIAGDIGIVMYKPLAMFFANDVEGANIIDCVSTGRMAGQFNEVLDDACLSVFAIMPTQQAVSGAILLGET